MSVLNIYALSISLLDICGTEAFSINTESLNGRSQEHKNIYEDEYYYFTLPSSIISSRWQWPRCIIELGYMARSFVRTGNEYGFRDAYDSDLIFIGLLKQYMIGFDPFLR